MADFREQFQAPTPTVSTGARLVTGINAERVKIDVSDEIYQYDPNANSLTLLVTKLRKKRKVSQFLFHWLEKDRLTRTTEATASATNAATTINVAVGTIAQPQALVLNTRTDEVFIVGTSAATQWTNVVRGLGGSASAINSGDTFEVIGSAYEENDDVGTAVHVAERTVSNNTQIIRTPYSYSGRDENTDMYGGKDPMTERKWQGVEHAISIERAMWWSQKDNKSGSAGNVTTMDGVHSFVGDNVWDINGIPFTERSYTEWLEYAMRFGKGGKMGSRNKFLFVAPRFLTEVESWAKDKLYYVPGDKIFGIDAAMYKSAHGKQTLISHPLFEERGDLGFLLDLNHVRYVFHQGRDTSLLKNRGGRGVDGETEEYLSDVSIQVEFGAAHGYLRNLPL